MVLRMEKDVLRYNFSALILAANKPEFTVEDALEYMGVNVKRDAKSCRLVVPKKELEKLQATVPIPEGKSHHARSVINSIQVKVLRERGLNNVEISKLLGINIRGVGRYVRKAKDLGLL